MSSLRRLLCGHRPSQRRLLCAAALAGFVPAGHAATLCSVGNISLSLGNYISYSATPVYASSSFLVTCTRNGGPASTSVTVALGPSFNSGSIANRQLRGGSGDLLNYNLYADPNRLSIWGQSSGVDTVSQTISLGNRTSGALTFTIFGKIDSVQDVSAGSYSDELTITVDF